MPLLRVPACLRHDPPGDVAQLGVAVLRLAGHIAEGLLRADALDGYQDPDGLIDHGAGPQRAGEVLRQRALRRTAGHWRWRRPRPWCKAAAEPRPGRRSRAVECCTGSATRPTC